MTINYGDKAVHCKNVHRLDPDQESLLSSQSVLHRAE